MRGTKLICMISCFFCVAFLLIGCGDKPEYYTPYGEGVDPDSVVTEPFQSRATETTTAFKAASVTTTTYYTTTTTQVTIPDGYKLCPTCGGKKVVCEYCGGTGKRKAESYDPDSDVFYRNYQKCSMCSKEDPGYMYCPTCKNKLVVPQ